MCLHQPEDSHYAWALSKISRAQISSFKVKSRADEDAIVSSGLFPKSEISELFGNHELMKTGLLRYLLKMALNLWPHHQSYRKLLVYSAFHGKFHWHSDLWPWSDMTPFQTWPSIWIWGSYIKAIESYCMYSTFHWKFINLWPWSDLTHFQTWPVPPRDVPVVWIWWSFLKAKEKLFWEQHACWWNSTNLSNQQRSSFRYITKWKQYLYSHVKRWCIGWGR